MFKMEGFTLASTMQLKSKSKQGTNLRVDEMSPMSLALNVTQVDTRKAQPDSNGNGSAQNGTLQAPEILSLYYAGAISPEMGAFVQLQYSNTGGFGLSMSDIRWATELNEGSRQVIVGVSANNQVSFSDPWQDTPSYWFPYYNTGVGLTPAASTQIEMAMGNVAGVGPYVYVPDVIGGGAIYASVEGYRSTANQMPVDSSTPMVISGVAPYWRLGWSKNWNNNSLEVGTFGYAPKISNNFMGQTNSVTSGPTDDFRDVGADMQYQYIGGNNIYSLEATAIREKQHWNTGYAGGYTSNTTDTLNHFKLTASWYHQRHYGLNLQYFDTTGTTDKLLYAPAAGTGSANGSPDSSGFVLQASYMPWYNTRFIAQYTAYNKFNGGKSNYDGYGRNASDNDQLLLGVWVLF